MSSFGFWKSSSTNCSSLSSTDSDGFCALFGYSSRVSLDVRLGAVRCGAFSLLFISRYSIATIFNLNATAVFTLQTQPQLTRKNPLFSSYFDPSLPSSIAFTSSPPLLSIARNLSNFPTIRHKAKAVPQPQDSEVSLVADAFTHFKHLLLPITGRNPYLSEGTRQAAATNAALAKNYGADITVVDEKQKEELPEHGTQLSSIRWHLSQGGFKEFKLLERLGEGSKATAIIAEVADDLNLDLVVMSMEAIRSKHVDANLLVEFIPCPVLFLPL